MGIVCYTRDKGIEQKKRKRKEWRKRWVEQER